MARKTHIRVPSVEGTLTAMNPTEDTPRERDEKAEVLRIEREALAEAVAKKLWWFRWEVRLWGLAVVIVWLIST